MNDSKFRLGLELFGAAAVLGLFAAAVVFPEPMGLNVTLWVGLVAITTLWLSYRWAGPLAGPDRWWIIPVFVFAAGYAWRDAPLLWLVRNLALVGLIVYVIGRAQAVHLAARGVSDASFRLIRPALRAVFTLPLFVWDSVDQAALRNEKRGRLMVAVGRGLVLGVPAVALFGALLVSADAVFERIIGDLIRIDEEDLARLFFFMVCTWTAGALLYGVLTEVSGVASVPANAATDRPRFHLGLVEVLVVLVLVDALFASFLFVQLGYFFGGAEHVVTQEGLTMAAYARRGFFELVAVTALALPLLLILSRLVRPASDREHLIFRLLAGLNVGLMVLLLLSAAQRMRLYTDAYGLTEQRLYVSVFLVWLLAMLGWFGATVLRDRARHFAPGAFVAALVLAIALHTLNPDALIVRTNVARALEGKPFDAQYAATLSGDAIPALFEALPRLKPEDQKTIARNLVRRETPNLSMNWRTWNWSRARAGRAMERNHALLERLVPHSHVQKTGVSD